MDKIKNKYSNYADKIWDKRFNSEYLIRRYMHRTEYYSILKYIPKGSTVLDAGCGEGVFSVLMAKKGINVRAFDISKPNIKTAEAIAKEKGVADKIEFSVGDAENIPFEDNSFDYVVSLHVLEHLPDFQKGLLEIKRVMRKKAIIAVPTCLNLSAIVLLGKDSPWEMGFRSPFAFLIGLFKVIKNIFSEGVNQNYIANQNTPHLWRYPWVFKKRLKEAGFKITKFEASTLCIPYLSYLFPGTIKVIKFLDMYKDKFFLNNFGYGSFAVVTKN
jgi:2-polyprenyl-3-methyl-5-hydroxy-6-metoxy-1,4-benzoquinol methylase